MFVVGVAMFSFVEGDVFVIYSFAPQHCLSTQSEEDVTEGGCSVGGGGERRHVLKGGWGGNGVWDRREGWRKETIVWCCFGGGRARCEEYLLV